MREDDPVPGPRARRPGPRGRGRPSACTAARRASPARPPAGRGQGCGQPATGSTAQGWSWPLAAGVRRWWVPPRTTANVLAVAALHVEHVGDVPAAVRGQRAARLDAQRVPGCGAAAGPGRRRTPAQSKRARGVGVVDGHAAAEVDLAQGDAVPGRQSRRPARRTAAATAEQSGAASPLARCACTPRSRSRGHAPSASSRGPRRRRSAGSMPNGRGPAAHRQRPAPPAPRPAGEVDPQQHPAVPPVRRRGRRWARTRSSCGLSTWKRPHPAVERGGDLGGGLARPAEGQRRARAPPRATWASSPPEETSKPSACGARARQDPRLGVGLGRVVQLHPRGQRRPDGGRVGASAGQVVDVGGQRAGGQRQREVAHASSGRLTVPAPCGRSRASAGRGVARRGRAPPVHRSPRRPGGQR